MRIHTHTYMYACMQTLLTSDNKITVDQKAKGNENFPTTGPKKWAKLSRTVLFYGYAQYVACIEVVQVVMSLSVPLKLPTTI